MPELEVKTLVGPNGEKIVGTLDTVLGVAGILGVTEDGGTMDIVYEGETRIDWNSQKPVNHDNGLGRVFVTDSGALFLERDVHIEGGGPIPHPPHSRLRIIIDVEYDLNGEDIAVMEAAVHRECERAVGDGLLTAGSGVEVIQHAIDVDTY
jgi:hypothetical protein